jgi:hypothetical protein
MKKTSIYSVIIIPLLILIVTSNFALKTKAHAAEGITLDFNLNTQMLNVSIEHAVEDPNTHYIDQIVINVNGSTVLTTPYTSQPSTAGGLYQYSITATNGSTIQALARCVEGGAIAGCIIVGVGLCPSPGGGIPGYFGLSVIIGISLLISLTITYKKIKHRK